MHCLSNWSKYWRIRYSLPRKWHQGVARWSKAKQGEARCNKMKQGVARCSKLCTKVWRPKTGEAGYDLYFPLWVAFFVLPICRAQKVTEGMQTLSCKQHGWHHLQSSCSCGLLWLKTQFSRIHLNDFAERGKDTLQQHGQCSSGQSM